MQHISHCDRQFTRYKPFRDFSFLLNVQFLVFSPHLKMPTSWEDIALVWHKETKPNRQGKLLRSHSHSIPPNLIQRRYSGWEHLPVQMAVNRWGEMCGGGGGYGAGIRETCTIPIHWPHHSDPIQSNLLDTTSEASSYMHRGPHAGSRAWSKGKVDPQQKSGTCARKRGQAEASTLLHESSNSEPETI